MVELLIPGVIPHPNTIKRIYNKLIQHFIITRDVDIVINVHDGTPTESSVSTPTLTEETTMTTPIMTTHIMPSLTITSPVPLTALPITKNLNEDIEVYKGDYVTSFDPEELSAYDIFRGSMMITEPEFSDTEVDDLMNKLMKEAYELQAWNQELMNWNNFLDKYSEA